MQGFITLSYLHIFYANTDPNFCATSIHRRSFSPGKVGSVNYIINNVTIELLLCCYNYSMGQFED